MNTDNPILTAGARFYYTGDAANAASLGTVLSVAPATRYAPITYTVRYDSPRFEGDSMRSTVAAYLFDGDIRHRRFQTFEEYDYSRKEKAGRLKAFLASRAR